MMAYSGRYRLRVDGCFITIVDSAWYPAWIGTEQTNFFTLDGDTLSIISPRGIVKIRAHARVRIR